MLPGLLAEHGDELAADVEMPRRLLDELGVVPSYYLHYFYATTRCSRSSDGRRARSEGDGDRARAAGAVPRSRPSTEKPALLEQRGGAYYSEAAIGLVASLATATAASTSSTFATTGRWRGSQRTTSSRCRRGSAATGAVPLAQAPLAPELLGLVQHVAAYEGLTAQAAVTRRPRVARRRCWRIRWSASRSSRMGCSSDCSRRRCALPCERSGR